MLRALFTAIALVFAIAGPAAAQISPSTIPNGQVGVVYPSQTFSNAGFTPTNGWSVTGAVPPGLTFSSSFTTAALAGTPATAGTYNFTVRANGMTGAFPVSNAQAYTVVVQPAAVAVPTMTEWAMILFGTILAGGAALYIQRRRQFI